MDGLKKGAGNGNIILLILGKVSKRGILIESSVINFTKSADSSIRIKGGKG